MKLLSILLFLLLLNGDVDAQIIPVIKFKDFEALSSKQNDTTYVFNFWATWCRPCVAELPAFEKLNFTITNEKVKVILISLDFKRNLNSVLQKFVEENDIRSQVLLLDELDYNSWINKVDGSWGGSIPATLVVNNQKGYRKFYEKEFIFDELLKAVNESVYSK